MFLASRTRRNTVRPYGTTGSVIVSARSVPSPSTVRYAWARRPTRANLYNRDGFAVLALNSS